MAALARFTRHLNDLKPVQKTKKNIRKSLGLPLILTKELLAARADWIA